MKNSIVLPFKGLGKNRQSQDFPFEYVVQLHSRSLDWKRASAIALGLGSPLIKVFPALLGARDGCHSLACFASTGACYFDGSFRKYEYFSGGLGCYLAFFGASPRERLSLHLRPLSL